jgi:uncharacterized protein YdaU (DUF1376 family)
VNYFEDHIGDYAAATAHLSWDEDMAYTRLIRAYYHTEKPIPKGQAYRLARASTAAHRRAVDAVLTEFFELREDGFHQKRCDEEIVRFHEKQGKARARCTCARTCRSSGWTGGCWSTCRCGCGRPGRFRWSAAAAGPRASRAPGPHRLTLRFGNPGRHGARRRRRPRLAHAAVSRHPRGARVHLDPDGPDRQPVGAKLRRALLALPMWSAL